uniref:Uncharacterized protein n=1 Tax=Myotis myotis TaxID=51298 RepID=A0A7J7WVR2_MYOMY|nr:hypothetical protein mMyoMyo1_011907 [Myotis myotis]
MKCHVLSKRSWVLLCLPMADTLRAPVLACHGALLSFLPNRCFFISLLPLPTSILASLLPFPSYFPQHLISLFCSGESYVWFLTFPQWHLKCFLVQNILFIAIETGSSVWKKKKRKEVWESEALQFCYFAQIHKWQHAGRYAKACCLRQQGKEGPPISRKLSQVLNPG